MITPPPPLPSPKIQDFNFYPDSYEYKIYIIRNTPHPPPPPPKDKMLRLNGTPIFTPYHSAHKTPLFALPQKTSPPLTPNYPIYPPPSLKPPPISQAPSHSNPLVLRATPPQNLTNFTNYTCLATPHTKKK